MGLEHGISARNTPGEGLVEDDPSPRVGDEHQKQSSVRNSREGTICEELPETDSSTRDKGTIPEELNYEYTTSQGKAGNVSLNSLPPETSIPAGNDAELIRNRDYQDCQSTGQSVVDPIVEPTHDFETVAEFIAEPAQYVRQRGEFDSRECSQLNPPVVREKIVDYSQDWSIHWIASPLSNQSALSQCDGDRSVEKDRATEDLRQVYVQPDSSALAVSCLLVDASRESMADEKTQLHETVAQVSMSNASDTVFEVSVMSDESSSDDNLAGGNSMEVHPTDSHEHYVESNMISLISNAHEDEKSIDGETLVQQLSPRVGNSTTSVRGEYLNESIPIIQNVSKLVEDSDELEQSSEFLPKQLFHSTNGSSIASADDLPRNPQQN
jgi:hypothetical protein